MKTLEAALLCWLASALLFASGTPVPVMILALLAAGFVLAAVAFLRALMPKR